MPSRSIRYRFSEMPDVGPIASASALKMVDFSAVTEQSPQAVNAASRWLQLTARLHLARGRPEVWRQVLVECRNRLSCVGALSQALESSLSGSDELEALAGRLGHCAAYVDECDAKCDADKEAKRAHCAALALHLHAAALAARKSAQAGLFDDLPPTWIVARDARLREANLAAKALLRDGQRFKLTGGCLGPVVPGGTTLLGRALAEVQGESQVVCKHRDGGETILRLRVLTDGEFVAVTLLADPPGVDEIAQKIAKRIDLTVRQSEVAAHLLTGHTLAAAARAMGISRHTASEHLAALLVRAGAPDRRALLVMLRRILHH